MPTFKLNDTWVSLPNDRKMQIFENFICIVSKDYDAGTPFSCPQCDILFADRDDFTAYHRYGCCKECSYGGVQSNIDE